MQGSTLEEVGDRFDGDLLGDDPIRSSLAAARDAIRTVADVLPTGGTVHLSYGEEKMDEYVHQLAADHLVHGWDLAVATGGDARLDPALVHEVATWFADREELYRAGGVVGARAAPTGEPQGDLLAAFGRDPHWGPNHAGLARFSAAFGSGDVDAVMALMTDDCAFEATGPAPDGVRHEGAEAVRAVWVELFGGRPRSRVHRGGVVRRRRPGRAALALRLDRRRRVSRPRPRSGRAPVPRRAGVREVLLRQGLICLSGLIP